MLTVTTNGSTDAGLSQLIHNDKKVAYLRPVEQERRERLSDAAQVDISGEARQLHRVGLLARQSEELRADKVNTLKEQILQGTYYVEPVEVAKAIVRSEISRLLGRG